LHRVLTLFLLILFYFILFVGCVYLCYHLPCTFDGWVHVLDFYIQGFPT
jgi:hypothetical protein